MTPSNLHIPIRPSSSLFGGALWCLVAMAGCDDPSPAPPLVEGTAPGAVGAHEHGVARLGLGVDGVHISMALQLPAESVYGFEHAPQSDAERETATAALAGLRSAAADLLVLPPDAACRLDSAEVEVDHPDDRHLHGEVTLWGDFVCAESPAGPASLAMVELLTGVEQVDLTVVTAHGQAAGRVAPDASFRF